MDRGPPVSNELGASVDLATAFSCPAFGIAARNMYGHVTAAGGEGTAQVNAHLIPVVAAPLNAAVALTGTQNSNNVINIQNCANSHNSVGYLAASGGSTAPTNTAILAGTSVVVAPSLAVASRFDTFFTEVIEAEVCHADCTYGLTAGGTAAVKAYSWSELTDWSRARECLLALGFSDVAESPWDKVGLKVDVIAPGDDALDRRARVLGMILSAKSAHPWGEVDSANASHSWTVIDDAFTVCRSELPEVTKALLKRFHKHWDSIPSWLEISPLPMKYALDTTDPNTTTIVLHLSNLQQMRLESSPYTGNLKAPHPRIAQTEFTRDLMRKLNLGEECIRDALRHFHRRSIFMWAPENTEQIPRILKSFEKLYTGDGVEVRPYFVVPFSPLPGCNSADSISDLWTHGCLHSNHVNVLKDTTFIVQASRCVHTRDVSPAHTIKNLAVFIFYSRAVNLLPSRCTACTRNLLKTRTSERAF